MRESPYSHLYQPVIDLLLERPRSMAEIRQELGITAVACKAVYDNLKRKGRLHHDGHGKWYVQDGNVTKDSSPFPAPPYWTPNIGLWC